MASSSSFSSSNVFISFRGRDIARNSINHLSVLLRQKGIKIFVQDEELSAGDEISSSHVDAIRSSSISIVFFSENYATSSRCLDQLVEIVEFNKTRGQIILPVYYNVTTFDLLKQLEKWMGALTDVANIPGLDIDPDNRNGASIVNQIAKAVFKRLKLPKALPTKKLSSSGVATRLILDESKAKKQRHDVDHFRSTWDGVGEKSISNDDADDGNVFIYNGRSRRISKDWQKFQRLRLGSGSVGTVYEAISDDGFFFAVKEVSLQDQSTQGKQNLEREISLLSQFQHENIVQYFGTDKDENMLYIFLELVPKGSLANLYQKYRLKDSHVSAYTRQVLIGLKYLHDHGVVHRDIKCANILVDASGSVKLADFGLAKKIKTNDVQSSKGTPFWMAPEVVNPKEHGNCGLAADIWSLGCTVLEMLTCQHPYSDFEGVQAIYQIGLGNPPPLPDDLSRDAEDFILKCIQVKQNDRPTAAQLLDHPFIKEHCE